MLPDTNPEDSRHMTPAGTDDIAKPSRRLLCSAVAGPLFVTVFVVEAARRPDYNPRRHPVSSLALGSRGWVQVTNFAAAGMLYLAGAAGLLHARDPVLGTRLGPALLGGVGLGLLGSAAFTTDPVSGYPPGTPDAPTQQTTNMTIHGLAALPIFLGIPRQRSSLRADFADPATRSGGSTLLLPACRCSPPWDSPVQVSIKHQGSSTPPDSLNASRS